SWVAEAGLRKLEMRSPSDVAFDIDAGKFTVSYKGGTVKKAREGLEKAQAAYARYIKDGKLTNGLLKGLMCLAQLDVIFRCGFVDENLGVAHEEDLRDLRRLIALVRPEVFRAKTRCLLNPDFGESSRLVGGADADLVIDGMLIDIKTVKNFELTRDQFNQLMGYFALHELSGFNSGRRKQAI